MHTHAIDFFYQHAGHVLRPYMSPIPAAPDDVCNVCQRPASLWRNPELKVIHIQGKLSETHCLSCRTLYEGSFELFGVGGYRGKNKDLPITMKLGMAEKYGMLVTPDQAILFLTGNSASKDKDSTRFLYAPKPPFEMVVLGGGDRVRSVLNKPPSGPFLFIHDFGKNSHSLVRNLKLSDHTTVHICEEKRLTVVDMQKYRILSPLVRDLPKPVWRTFRTMMEAIATGRLSPDHEEVSAFLRANPVLRDAVAHLPQDPWLRLDLLKWLEN